MYIAEKRREKNVLNATDIFTVQHLKLHQVTNSTHQTCSNTASARL